MAAEKLCHFHPFFDFLANLKILRQIINSTHFGLRRYMIAQNVDYGPKYFIKNQYLASHTWFPLRLRHSHARYLTFYIFSWELLRLIFSIIKNS